MLISISGHDWKVQSLFTWAEHFQRESDAKKVCAGGETRALIRPQQIL
jgi:methylglyoxal synthase